MKTAIVHEWFVTYAGSEKVVGQIISQYPDADNSTLVDFLPARDRTFLNSNQKYPSFIQRLPITRTVYRKYPPFMPLTIE